MGCVSTPEIIEDVENEKMTLEYIPLGDSYTIGTGAPSGAWPLVLTKHLQEEGVDIDLVVNPARNGFTTRDLIEFELPVLEKERPDVTTILIGVNDWVQGVSEGEYRENLIEIFDRVLKVVPKEKIVVITIPDFGVTPKGMFFSGGRDISEGITGFNNIIKEEAEKRDLSVVDIFPVSQEFSEEDISKDGLHPSSQGYKKWEELIFPVMLKKVKEK